MFILSHCLAFFITLSLYLKRIPDFCQKNDAQLPSAKVFRFKNLAQNGVIHFKTLT